MGMHTAIVIDFDQLHRVGTDEDFGDKLFHARGGRKPFPEDTFTWVGEVHSSGSLPIFHFGGKVWSPNNKRMERMTDGEGMVRPDRKFCLLGISGDLVSDLCGVKDLGNNVATEILQQSRSNPNPDGSYLREYGQALYIVTIFQSQQPGVAVLEGNCSWVVGKQDTPLWARAAKKWHKKRRELLELTLALKQGVPVNLTEARYQSLAQYL